MLHLFAFFFFNDTATTEIYTLSLHDALPISRRGGAGPRASADAARAGLPRGDRRLLQGRRRHRSQDATPGFDDGRSEEHTSELQSLAYLVCRLLLEKKKTKKTHST